MATSAVNDASRKLDLVVGELTNLDAGAGAMFDSIVKSFGEMDKIYKQAKADMESKAEEAAALAEQKALEEEGKAVDEEHASESATSFTQQRYNEIKESVPHLKSLPSYLESSPQGGGPSSLTQQSAKAAPVNTNTVNGVGSVPSEHYHGMALEEVSAGENKHAHKKGYLSRFLGMFGVHW